jgi:non-heme chloroperoxidase
VPIQKLFNHKGDSMPYIRTKDSTDIYVKDWGAGRPVILISCWPFSADCWDAQALALAEAGYRVITYDRRGFGRSSQPDRGYDYDTLADDLAAVIETTAAKDATIIGYSMGGGEVVRYMSRHNGAKIIKAGLIGSVVPYIVRAEDNPSGVDAQVFEGIKESLRQNRLQFYAGFFKDFFYDTETSPELITQELLDWSLQMAMQAGLRGTIACVDTFTTDFRAELSAMSVPTLILHGTADKPVPIDPTGRAAAAGIRQSRLIEYQGASHGLLVTEKERLTRDLLDFLASE